MTEGKTLLDITQDVWGRIYTGEENYYIKVLGPGNQLMDVVGAKRMLDVRNQQGELIAHERHIVYKRDVRGNVIETRVFTSAL